MSVAWGRGSGRFLGRNGGREEKEGGEEKGERERGKGREEKGERRRERGKEEKGERRRRAEGTVKRRHLTS